MKCRCPACSKNTQVPMELLGFLARCERCGALLRPKMVEAETEDAGGVAARTVRIVARAISVGHVRAAASSATGAIAELLSRPLNAPALATVGNAGTQSSRSGDQAPFREIAMSTSSETKTTVGETVEAVTAQRAARRAAIRKAQLKASKLGLGVLGVFGLIMLALIATCLFAFRGTARGAGSPTNTVMNDRGK